MSYLQRKIKQSWFPPIRAINDSVNRCVIGVVIVRFDLHKDGSVSNLKLYKSSGQVDLDQSGLDAVRKACPFETLPEGAPDPVLIEFKFDTTPRLPLSPPAAPPESEKIQQPKCIVQSWFTSSSFFDEP